MWILMCILYTLLHNMNENAYRTKCSPGCDSFFVYVITTDTTVIGIADLPTTFCPQKEHSKSNRTAVFVFLFFIFLAIICLQHY